MIERDISKQTYLHQTKLPLTSAIFKKYTAEERITKIVDHDDSCQNYKTEFKKQLQNAWDHTLKVTQPYKYDPLTNLRASSTNLPESRNRGYRLNASVVEDYMQKEFNSPS